MFPLNQPVQKVEKFTKIIKPLSYSFDDLDTTTSVNRLTIDHLVLGTGEHQ